MKQGFTLLELIVVIIIIGVLATLGLGQYMRMVEKSRGAEARAIIGAIRANAAAIYMQNSNSCANCSAANLGIAAGADYPPACAATHYFSYASAITAGNNGITVTATRCLTGGASKNPGSSYAGTIVLTNDFTTGQDTWSFTGVYQ